MGQKESSLRGWIKNAADIAVIVLIVLAAKTAIAEPFYVPSGSMEPTLLIGDELLATKYAYGYSTASLPAPITLPQTERLLGRIPSRGDVVVFRYPGDRSTTWVKRVIGLPGDRIALKAGQVWINGTPAAIRPDGTGFAQDEEGSQFPAARFIETLPGNREHVIFKLRAHTEYDDMAEIVIPPDHLFVMGDNRDNSADSRIALKDGGVGLLPIEDLVGRVDVIVGSMDLSATRQPIWTWPAALRFSRFFSMVH
jgi:signal peptidase I